LNQIKNNSIVVLNSLNSLFHLRSAFTITGPERQKCPESLYIISVSDSEDSDF